MYEVVLVFHNLENIILKNCHCFQMSLHNPKIEYLPLGRQMPFST